MPRPSSFRLYLLGLLLLLGAYVALEYNRPKPLDWRPSYINKDKIPYGTFVLYDQLPRLLGTDSIAAVRRPVFGQLTDQDQETTVVADTAATTDNDEQNSQLPDSAVALSPTPADQAVDSIQSLATEEPDEDEDEDEPTEEEITAHIPLRPEPANYLFVNESFMVSSLDAQTLLRFVAAGNDVFIAAESFRSFLGDTLGFQVEAVELPARPRRGLPAPDSITLRFTNRALAGTSYRLGGAGNAHRIEVDSGRIGRTLATDAQGRPVYVRLDHGRGHFYICSVPRAFTNYYFLRPRTTGFAAAVLAYLPARRTWWDEFQKQGPVGEQSLLRVLLAHDALRTAYYLVLLGTLLFVAVYARRRQRVIPTLNPLPNTTLLFTRTVAGLYRQGRSHGLIAEKKVALFQDYLRTRFHETSPDFGDEAFRERLSQKAGLPRPRVDELLRLVNFARTAPQMTDQQLLRLSKALSDFRREANR